MLHAFAGLDQRRKVHDPVDLLIPKYPFQQFPVCQIPFDQTGSGWNEFPVTMAEVVVNQYIVPG